MKKSQMYAISYQVRYNEEQKALKKLEGLGLLNEFYCSQEHKKYKYFKTAFRKFCERKGI